jgi:hypothetical protein
MTQPIAEKRDRFKRMFPPRVEKLVDTMRLIGNCTNKQNYDWDEDLVKRCWIEIAKMLEETADLFGVKFSVQVNDVPVIEIDTNEPLS